MCKTVTLIFALAYLAALFLLLVGTFGWFGQERDPLAAVFLLPLGLPWNQFLDLFGEAFRPWLAALSPLLNLMLLRMICGFAARS
ncbi:hypothetical protein OEZ49_17485 [Ruegeria sp. WL0004]|uniref:Uncharacterized protein n=1 Tax=Ruegeria marisflavi TaxID=2984152 RepID=A0ABT2WUI1_9RHOB|nr:hypothetical protein [Ruegeria sp. WL0004]MCU9839570.1 hypothetical protein [Ruegeria sp. WL0004]